MDKISIFTVYTQPNCTQFFSPQDSSVVYTTHISYLEIYNEMGYDLLDSRNEASRLEDLPQVSYLILTFVTVLPCKSALSNYALILVLKRPISIKLSEICWISQAFSNQPILKQSFVHPTQSGCDEIQRLYYQSLYKLPDDIRTWDSNECDQSGGRL